MLAVLLGLSVAVQEETRLRHPDPPFQMTIPEGFERIPPSARQIYAFQRVSGKKTGSMAVEIIAVELLSGTIPRNWHPEMPRMIEEEAKAAFPSDVKVRSLKERWRGFEVDKYEFRYSLAGTEWISYAVDLPLITRGMRIQLVGEASEEPQLLSDLSGVVSSVVGRTNWLTSTQRWMALGAGVPALTAWAMLVLYAIGHVSLFRNQPLRLWRTRLGWLSAALILFMVAMVMSLVYSAALGGKAEMNYFQMVPAAICLIVADKVRRDGLKARSVPAAPSP